MNKQTKFPIKTSVQLSLVSATLLMSAASYAQTPDAGSLINETKSMNGKAATPTNQNKVMDIPERQPISMPEGVTIKVAGFKVIDARSYSEADLLKLLQPWVGKTVDLNELNKAAGEITRHYQSQGHFLSYAYLPAQKIADGIIEIAVMEGKLDNVEVVTAQGVRLQDEVIQAHVTQPNQAKSSISQAEMERRLLLVNDIPGVVARAAFKPGGQRGTADMVVSVAEEDPFALQLGINNYGNPSTGKYIASASAALKDLFGAGDFTQAQFLISHTGDLVNGSLNSKLPLGGNGLYLGGGISRLSYQLGKNFSALGGIGQALVYNVNMGYPVIRSFNRNLNLQTNLTHNKLTDEVVLTGLKNHKQSDALDIDVSYDQRDNVLQGGYFSASANFEYGHLELKEPTQIATDTTGLQTAGKFQKLSFDLLRQQQITNAWGIRAHLAGQQANKNLDSSEKLALTGPSKLRAFPIGEASVDNGRYLNLDAQYTHRYAGGSLTASVFHDHGWGEINENPLIGAGMNNLHLYGNGLGLQWSNSDNMGITSSIAWRGNNPTHINGKNPQLYFQFYKKL